jgi:hypothetical protein
MSDRYQLSLEQQFSLRTISSKVQALSRQEAQELVVELQRQMMIKDNLYKQLIKHEWGI